jgi:hypothetical protein
MLAPKILASGNVVDVMNLQPEDILAWDIVWALCHINRYTGACRQPWDVGSHSGLCHMLGHVQRPDMDVNTRLAIMLHDSAEAYTGDMTSHMKADPRMAWFRVLEADICTLILERFGVERSKVDWEFVQLVDKQAASQEMSYFWPEFDQRTVGPVPEVPDGVPMVKIKPKLFIEAMQMFAVTALAAGNLFEVPATIVRYIDADPVLHARAATPEENRQAYALRSTDILDQRL